jgi:thiamine biosynthesis lipoprotein
MRLLILLLVGLVLAGCGREPLYQSQAYVFGTLVDVSIYGEPEDRARALADHVFQEFQRLHDSLHAWKPGSELDKLNRAFAAGAHSTEITPELAGILRDATQISNQSGSLFNPAIGGLIGIWGFQRDEFTPVRPDPAQIAALLKAAPAMSDIVIEGNTAYSGNSAVRLDLGGYAKGYALDLAAAYLRKEKVPGALVNIGGNIIAIGRRGERPWHVGIQHPRQAGAIAAVDLADGWAIGTSGDYQRFFEQDGKRYCHVIDARSGYPVMGVQAVTILVPPGPNTGALSDAASKPIFISGAEKFEESTRRMGIEYAMLIDGMGRIFLTSPMKTRLKLLDKDAKPERAA